MKERNDEITISIIIVKNMAIIDTDSTTKDERGYKNSYI